MTTDLTAPLVFLASVTVFLAVGARAMLRPAVLRDARPIAPAGYAALVLVNLAVTVAALVLARVPGATILIALAVLVNAGNVAWSLYYNRRVREEASGS